MAELLIEQIDPIKIPLIKKLYKDYYPSAKPKKDELVVTLLEENQLSGVVRFRAIEQYRLLTGMLIIPDKRGKGLSHQLLTYCVQNILTQTDYCFAYSHLAALYKSHGFDIVDIVEMPSSIQGLFLRYVNSGKDLIPMHFVGLEER